MKISTQVVTTTQITLNQDEITLAVIEYVKANADLPADAKFQVDYADDNHGDLNAIVNVAGSLAEEFTDPPTIKPKETRTRTATKTVVAAQQPAATVTEPVEPVTPVKSDETPADDKPEIVADDPPFVPDPVAEPATIPATKTPPGKIFPETGTSAPPAAVKEEAPPVADDDVLPEVKAKSLFANLVKPS